MSEERVVPLADLAVGRHGTVVALHGGRRFQTRIVSMGLHPGSEVEVVQGGNGKGGPVIVAIGSTRLAIGKGMSDRIMVATDPLPGSPASESTASA